MKLIDRVKLGDYIVHPELGIDMAWLTDKVLLNKALTVAVPIDIDNVVTWVWQELLPEKIELGPKRLGPVVPPFPAMWFEWGPHKHFTYRRAVWAVHDHDASTWNTVLIIDDGSKAVMIESWRIDLKSDPFSYVGVPDDDDQDSAGTVMLCTTPILLAQALIRCRNVEFYERRTLDAYLEEFHQTNGVPATRFKTIAFDSIRELVREADNGKNGFGTALSIIKSQLRDGAEDKIATPQHNAPHILESLDAILSFEQQNRIHNIAIVGPNLVIAEKLLYLYASVLNIIRKATTLDDEGVNFFFSLVGGCQRQFVVGFDRLLKGYYTDSYHCLRVAVEAACFAYKGYCDPESIPVWLDSITGDEAHREFQKRFKHKFPGDDPAMDHLRSVYDECAKKSHANPRGIIGVIARDEGTVECTFFDKPAERDLTWAFLTAMHGHTSIFSILLPMVGEFAMEEMLVKYYNTFSEIGALLEHAGTKMDDQLHYHHVITTTIH